MAGRSIQSSGRSRCRGARRVAPSIRPVAFLTVVFMALVAAGVTAGAVAPAPLPRDPLQTLLADEDYDSRRDDLLRELQRPGLSSCRRLEVYAEDRNERVREHAVRLQDDAGCSDFAVYRPYIADPSPWVTEAILKAAEHRLIGEAVPFLVDRLGDHRTILSGEGSWTIAESAYRALRKVSCQSFHFDPEGGPRGQADAIAQWGSWYTAHRSEPRAAWVASGIALAHDYLARDYAPHRKEGLELLTLIGSPALPELRAAFLRAPQDLRTSLTCAPEEPPRVVDQVPCVLLVMNASRRRLALAPAPGDPDVELSRFDDPRPESRGDRSRAGRPSGFAPADLLGRVVDLPPGGVLRREFKVGPVRSAGRYEVHAVLPDLASLLGAPEAPKAGDAVASSTPKQAGAPRPIGSKKETPPKKDAPAKRDTAPPPRAAPLPVIEASTVLRFEQ